MAVTLAALVATSTLAARINASLNSSRRAPTLPYQSPVSELQAPEQDAFVALRELIYDLEALRSDTGTWPQASAANIPGYTTQVRSLGLTHNYVFEPDDGQGGQRFLVMILEPDPRLKEPCAPHDEEHHTLASGICLHVTVWTQAAKEHAAPTQVTAFPFSEGFVQRIAQVE